jgi:hypothetical protein
MNFHKHRHAYIECVPLDKEAYDDCALYFQKVKLSCRCAVTVACSHGVVLFGTTLAGDCGIGRMDAEQDDCGHLGHVTASRGIQEENARCKHPAGLRVFPRVLA